MPNFAEILVQDPFGLPQTEKETWYRDLQLELNSHHYQRCRHYRQIIDCFGKSETLPKGISDLPFIPVRLFKNFDLKSTDDKEIAKTLTSSGTSGNAASRIHLDRKAVLLQSRVLKYIFSSVFPSDRDTTMFVVEKPSSLTSKAIASASVAAIRGFSQFAKNVVPLINDNGQIDLYPLTRYVQDNPAKPFVIFGFTAPVWTQLVQKLREQEQTLQANNGMLIHGGGWKKLAEEAVSKATFNATAKSTLGVSSVYNYYGMVEQTGSVFPECEHGFFHPSLFSEVIIRNENLEPADIGEPGLIQCMTLLAESYPGHNLLTDDIGVLHGNDHCKCGRRGKFFTVLGRAPGVELRGCSDAK